MKKKKSVVLLLLGIISLSLVIYFGSNAIKKSLNEPTNSTTVADNKSVEQKEEGTEKKQDDSKDKTEANDSKAKDTNKQEVSKETSDEKDNKQSTTTNNNTSAIANSNDNAKKAEVKATDKGQTSVSKSSETDSKNQTENNKPTQTINFTISNATNGQVLFSASVTFDGSTTLESYMNTLLTGKPHKISDGYVSMMFNLKERGMGPLSGWVYYINGVKPGYGIKDYSPKPEDKIQWKYVKDGINN